MTFDGQISVGTIVEVGLLLLGLAGGWATLKLMQKVQERQLTELKSDVDEDRKQSGYRHDANLERMSKIELRIADECLKKDDFREFERRFDAKVEKIEHAAGNAATKAAGIIADLLRSQGRVRRDSGT